MPSSITITIRVDRILAMAGHMAAAAEQIAGEVAQEIGTDAQSRAPVLTGFMRDNIGVEHTGQGAYQIHSAAPYSGWVEEGTRHQSAQPFMRPACERGAASMNEKAMRFWGLL